jgi:hypothetical protein
VNKPLTDNSATPLFIAAFMGRVEVVRLYGIPLYRDVTPYTILQTALFFVVERGVGGAHTSTAACWA